MKGALGSSRVQQGDLQTYGRCAFHCWPAGPRQVCPALLAPPHACAVRTIDNETGVVV